MLFKMMFKKLQEILKKKIFQQFSKSDFLSFWKFEKINIRTRNEKENVKLIQRTLTGGKKIMPSIFTRGLASSRDNPDSQKNYMFFV